MTLLARLPYLQTAVVDWDESTFILVGQSLIDGHLPNKERWDNKPPLAFAFSALTILGFGQSIAAVRVADILWITATAVLVYVLGRRLGDRRAGLIGAVLSILAVSAIGSGPSVMTEHVALLPLMAALDVAVVKRPGLTTLWWLGVLLGLAAMVRLNLAYAAVVVGAGVLLLPPRPRGGQWLLWGAAYAAGGPSVVALTFLPYLISGQAELWWSSVVAAPLAYSQQLSLFNLGHQQIRNGLGVGQGLTLANHMFWMGCLLWLGGAAGLVLALVERVRGVEGDLRGLFLVLIFLLGTGLSVIASGVAHPHHLIQLVPFFALGCGLVLSRWLAGPLRVPVAVALALVMVLAFRPIWQAHHAMLEDLAAGRGLSRGVA